MSSRSRSRRRRREIGDDEIKDLVSNLQHLLPTAPSSNHHKVSSARILQETCNYIRSLRREVEELSDTLSDLLENTDTTIQALITTFLMH